jgi:hypothetical protein
MMEGGKNSITKQIESMGFKPIVVSKNGKGHEKNKWNASNTFRRGAKVESTNWRQSDNQTIRQSDNQTIRQSDNQTIRQSDNQTIRQSDNQTRKYDMGDMDWRCRCEYFAWGQTDKSTVNFIRNK